MLKRVHLLSHTIYILPIIYCMKELVIASVKNYLKTGLIQFVLLKLVLQFLKYVVLK